MAKKTWRSAVKQQMYEATMLQAAKSKGPNHPPFLYRWEHVSAVVAVATKLAKKVKADEDIVEAAAWLHDVKKEMGNRHPQEGAKFAREFLPTTDFPKKKIEKVAQAIEEHMGLWRDKPLKSLESQVLWDADKLTKIGLTAAVHWSLNGVAANKQTTTEDVIMRLNSAEWRKKTVSSMHTKPAKKAAKKRFAAYDAFVKGLSAEWNAEDI